MYGGFLGSSLNAACSSNNIRIAECLIKAGAEVNRFGKLSLLDRSLRAELEYV